MEKVDRFYDAETGGTMQLQLERDGSNFRIVRPFGYRDPAHEKPFVVPADPVRFRTDLTSIPWFFAWLVPGVGSHLPAVLLHDGLVLGKGETEKTHKGPDVDREEADRILRDAMASLGVPVIRRWLMWTAVILATAFAAIRPRWYWISVASLTLGTVVVLGTIATLDLVDAWDVLPWMDERPTWQELLGGALFALVIPLALSLLWRRLWRAGAILGVALAFLFHVTLALFVLYAVYRVAEDIVSAPEGQGANVEKNLEQIPVG
jgi:hypothetical protein